MMDELIERLEKATGPSDDLDEAIAKALGWTRGEWQEHDDLEGRGFLPWISPDGRNQGMYGSALRSPIGRLTASIEAALTLVPDGWQWQVSNRAPEPKAGRAYIHNIELQFAGLGGMRPNPQYRGEEATAATPALALCIAALRARASRRAGKE